MKWFIIFVYDVYIINYDVIVNIIFIYLSYNNLIYALLQIKKNSITS